MKLQRITLNYEGYLDGFRTRHRDFLDWDYDNQYRVLMDEAFGWANFLTINLGTLGWEVWEPVTNFEENQKKWALEHAVSYSEKGWFLEIVKAQIAVFQPDVLFVDSFTAFDAGFLKIIRAENPKIKLIVGWCGAPCPDYGIFEAFDLTLSNIPTLVDELRDSGLRAEHLPHSFETSILDRLDSTAGRNISFTFTGSIFVGARHHADRLKLLDSLASKTSLQIYADLQTPQSRLKTLCLNWKGGAAGLVDVLRCNAAQRRIAMKAKPALYGMEMYHLLAKSQITFNNQIGMSKLHASNTRLFQATGCGACLLTDWKPDLSRYFKPDEEVVAYRNTEEAIEKAVYLLDHPDVSRAIADAGQKRTLRDHSFYKRAEVMNAIFRSNL